MYGFAQLMYLLLLLLLLLLSAAASQHVTTTGERHHNMMFLVTTTLACLHAFLRLFPPAKRQQRGSCTALHIMCFDPPQLQIMSMVLYPVSMSEHGVPTKLTCISLPGQCQMMAPIYHTHGVRARNIPCLQSHCHR